MNTALTNGTIITEQGVLRGHALLLRGDRIAACVPQDQLWAYPLETVVDVQGQCIAPGFVDVHSDMIESIISPRPSAMMDFEMAIKEGERQLLNQGITTMYHSLSLYRDTLFGIKEVRKACNVARLAQLIDNLAHRGRLIHHRFHARFEIDNVSCLDELRALIEQGLVHELSIMDHTPGQGQYRNLEIYRRQISGYRDQPLSDEEWNKVMRVHQEKERATMEELHALIIHAQHCGIAVSSHDDDTVEKVELVHSLGVDISEFPITMEAARRAKALGMMTVGGAPNVLLGGSHSGNLSATEAILEGCMDVLCSDYYPAAMLHAVFALHRKHKLPLHKAVNLVSLNPARAVGIHKDYGSIEAGKKADLLFIGDQDGYPVITSVWIEGQQVSQIQYRNGQRSLGSRPAVAGAGVGA